MKPKLLVVLVGFAVAAYFIFTGKQEEAARTSAMPSVAGDLGLDYSKSANASELSSTSFPLFVRGEDVQVSNVMRGKSGDANVSVFDLGYRIVTANNEIAGNENPGRTDQTAVLVAGSKPLPDFVLRPTNVLETWAKTTLGEGIALVKDKAGDRVEMAAEQLNQLTDQMRGYTNRLDPRVSSVMGDISSFIDAKVLTDINFDSNTEFSDRYLLTGSDELAIRKVFTPEVMQHLVGMAKPLSVEAKGGELLAYRGGEFASIEGMEGMITQVKTLQNLLAK